jgi:hypothetical protein
MANAWNELSWGLGDWGLQSDALIIPTGVFSSVSVNSIDYAGEPGGWGQFTWGFNEWGDLLNPNVDVTGLQLNTSVGNEDSFTDISVLVTGEQLNLLFPVITTSNLQNVSGTSDNILFTFRPGTASKVQYVGAGWNVVGQPTFIVTSVSLDPNDQYTGTITITGGTFVSGQSYRFESPNADVSIGVLIVPDSYLLNTTVNSVFGGESVIAEVVTPGTPTTWGQSTFGSYSWGQITGTQLELGDEFVFTNVNVLLNGNQLAVTLDPNYEILLGILEQPTGVLITSTVNSVFAGELIITNVTGITINSTSGILDISADANVTANTNLLNITIGDESITGDANLTLNTNLLNAAVGNVDNIIDVVVEVTTPGSPSVWGEFAWGQQGWGRIVGLEVEQGGEEVVVPSVEVDVIGVQLNTAIGSLSITADANLTLNTNLLTVSLGDEEGLPNTIVTLSTNLLNVSVGTASGQALVDVAVTGVNMTTSTGRLFVSAWAVVNIGVTNTWTVVDIAA